MFDDNMCLTSNNTVKQNKVEEVKICSWNVNGMSSEKSILIENFVCNYDIVCLQETWNTADRNIDIQNFKSLHFNRTHIDKKANRGAGGISILVKDHLCPKISIVRQLTIKEAVGMG